MHGLPDGLSTCVAERILHGVELLPHLLAVAAVQLLTPVCARRPLLSAICPLSDLLDKCTLSKKDWDHVDVLSQRLWRSRTIKRENGQERDRGTKPPRNLANIANIEGGGKLSITVSDATQGLH